jgi:hypothetical protein
MGAEGKESPWHRAWSQPQSPVSRANYLFFIGLAELSVLNAHISLTIFGYGYPCFSSSICVENNCCDGFFLTVLERIVLLCRGKSQKISLK